MSRPSRAAYCAAPVICVAVAFAITLEAAYLPMRVALVTMVAVLSVLPLVVRATGLVPGLADGATPAVTRTLGWLLVAATATQITIAFRHSDTTERVSTGLPITTTLLATCLVGILAVTARSVGAGRRGLAVGAAFGLGAASVWLLAVAMNPPVPGNAALASLLVFAAVAAAAYFSRRGDLRGAALTAGTIASLSIVVLVGALMSVVPDRWVPQIVTVAMTPAANVSESRIETSDPYVALLLLGSLFGVALIITFVPGVASRLGRSFAPPAPTTSAFRLQRSTRP